jgi:predicted HD phosphohydrolase
VSAHLITACLLHDLGHLIAEYTPTSELRWIDDKHQYFVLPFLRGLFDREVLEPIRLHVEAKRYLCFIDPDYEAKLSDHSRRSLVSQGGSFDASQSSDFSHLPGAPDAIRLRRWDDQAKVISRPTKPLDHYLDIAAAWRFASRCCIFTDRLPLEPLLPQAVSDHCTIRSRNLDTNVNHLDALFP